MLSCYRLSLAVSSRHLAPFAPRIGAGDDPVCPFACICRPMEKKRDRPYQLWWSTSKPRCRAIADSFSSGSCVVVLFSNIERLVYQHSKCLYCVPVHLLISQRKLSAAFGASSTARDDVFGPVPRNTRRAKYEADELS